MLNSPKGFHDVEALYHNDEHGNEDTDSEIIGSMVAEMQQYASVATAMQSANPPEW
jgi:hypothetical protein